MRIEVKGSNGDSIVLTGDLLIQYRNHGSMEVMRNPASSYVETEIRPIHQKGAAPKNCDVTITCKANFSMKMPMAERPQLDKLVDHLELASEML
jgi:hypothetical protein